eukprot:CAMPEP_0206589030 /NCGR_PEP_ID=MMETSP0325_2-20121206/38655_1 /ASSEMBLY_ACC=CAM_ASM_000347 /TAXON_ID=2866 /ORGANISM="Crypthecodinium cohnii, Strain Seligo" /LENGTH=30 /DNA_ID= /DNA_START= /DNA_END= /DNA_ORIENTATION=
MEDTTQGLDRQLRSDPCDMCAARHEEAAGS